MSVLYSHIHDSTIKMFMLQFNLRFFFYKDRTEECVITVNKGNISFTTYFGLVLRANNTRYGMDYPLFRDNFFFLKIKIVV